MAKNRGNGVSGRSFSSISMASSEIVVSEFVQEKDFLQDIEKEKKRSKNTDSMKEDESEEVSEIKASDFEESMKYARRSVSDADIRKYKSFTQTLQQSRVFGTESRFDTNQSATVANATTSAEATNDLYD
ncbi:hypothetical protein SOVF_133620 [Spinacia oleracea]|nr:hypothetical protein SOVF_133620 [Spinacia oleracea]